MEEHAFHSRSRAWVYTASRSFRPDEVRELDRSIDQFCSNWTAHDKQLFARGSIRFDRLLVLLVDETQAGASGCSIDKSVHFLQSLGKQFDCDFFVRNLVALDRNGAWEWIDFKTIPALLDSGNIDAQTLIIDTLINDLEGLSSWEKPIKASWLKRYLKEPAL